MIETEIIKRMNKVDSLYPRSVFREKKRSKDRYPSTHHHTEQNLTLEHKNNNPSPSPSRAASPCLVPPISNRMMRMKSYVRRPSRTSNKPHLAYLRTHIKTLLRIAFLFD